MLRRWTEIEESALANMASKKMRAKEIANMLGRTEIAVKTRMSRLGLESQCSKGNHSRVQDGTGRGGTITIRLPRKLHRRFVDVCKEQRVSMNESLVLFVRRAIDEIERKTTNGQ